MYVRLSPLNDICNWVVSICCGADSENLIYPIVLTLGGFIIAYITRGDYYDID
jgi:hypothetical protein